MTSISSLSFENSSKLSDVRNLTSFVSVLQSFGGGGGDLFTFAGL